MRRHLMHASLFQAMANNGQYMGERFVRLLPVGTSEMEEQVRMGTLAIPASMRNKMVMRRKHQNFVSMGASPLLFPHQYMPPSFMGPSAAGMITGGQAMSGCGIFYPHNPSYPPVVYQQRQQQQQQQQQQMPQW